MTLAVTRVVELRELLSPPDVLPLATPGPAASAPEHDSAQHLEEMRQEVLARAEREGYEAGMSRSQAAIDAATTSLRCEARASIERDRAAQAELAARLESVMATLAREVDRQDGEVTELALDVAWAVVARVLGHAAVTREAMAPICEQALAEFQVRPVTLQLAACDHDVVSELLTHRDSVLLEVDALLAPGTCRLQSRRGLYETGIATRLRAVTEALIAQLESRR